MRAAAFAVVLALSACTHGSEPTGTVPLFSTTAREHGMDEDTRFEEVERQPRRSVIHTHLKGYGGAIGGSLLTIEVLCELASQRGFEYWATLEEGPVASNLSGFRGWRRVVGFAHDDDIAPFEAFPGYQLPDHPGPVTNRWMPADVRQCFEAMMTWPLPGAAGTPAEPAAADR